MGALKGDCLDAGNGCDVFAIPHNSNISGGGIFLTENDDMTPFDSADAKWRSEIEPLVEIFQHKAESECHPMFSTDDELCGFEKTNAGTLAPGTTPLFRNFVRNVLRDGIAEEEALGANPFRLGIIASTDTHMGISGATREDGYVGHVGNFDAMPSQRLIDFTTFHAGANPGGLAVVWAEENSRDSLFSAMQRREVYGTSGTRPVLRFFGGDFKGDPCDDGTLVESGYQRGVPMGGEIGAIRKKKSPMFMVEATKDPGPAGAPGSPLQRVQIIKGWVDSTGTTHEKVIDVVGDANNGASVDESTCTPTGTGADHLCEVWEDPEFDASQRAFYYARVIENPTCRYTTYICNDAGVDCAVPASIPAGFELCCDPGLAKTIQERAWSSPIWYRPDSFGKTKASIKRKGAGEDQLKLKTAFQDVPHGLDPDNQAIEITLADDDEIWSVVIGPGALTPKKPGAVYTLSDKTGALGGIAKATLKISSKGTAKLSLKTIKMDLSNADLSTHFIRTTFKTGDFTAEHRRLWTAKGTTLKAAN